MKPLVLLILGSVWAAVLIPPLLRSRVENRPYSSVTDFRRQLSKLQNTVPGRNGGHVSMARPLVQSPLQRPAAAGRPGQPSIARRQHDSARGRSSVPQRQARYAMEQSGRSGQMRGAPQRNTSARYGAERGANQRYARSHGTGGAGPQRQFARSAPGATPPRGRRRPNPNEARYGSPRQTQVHRAPATDIARRRRTNVFFAMFGVALVALFFATKTRSTALMYLFALLFVALCGYMYLLSQARTREADQWGTDWMS